jgi:hypothetical protein
MTSTTKVDQAARQRARERRIALDEGRKARDERIEGAAALVFAGVAAREEALAGVTRAEATVGDALRALTGEGLTTAQVAELCELSLGEVQRLIKRHRDSESSKSPVAPRIKPSEPRPPAPTTPGPAATPGNAPAAMPRPSEGAAPKGTAA